MSRDQNSFSHATPQGNIFNGTSVQNTSNEVIFIPSGGSLYKAERFCWSGHIRGNFYALKLQYSCDSTRLSKISRTDFGRIVK